MKPALITIAIASALAFIGMEFLAKEPASPVPASRGLALREALKGADRIELTPNFTDEPKDLAATITGAEKISGLIGTLDFIDPEGVSMEDMCDGEYTIRFFRADKELVTLSHHHGYSLRWHGGKWKGDSSFTQSSMEAWPKWFNDNGFPAFEQARLKELAGKEEERRKLERFLEPFPPSARTTYEILMKDNEKELAKDKSAAASRFLEACGLRYDAGIAICRALGSLHDSTDGAWSYISVPEQLVVATFGLIDMDTKAGVFDAALKERGADLGAVQLFFDGRFHRDLSSVARDSLAPGMLRLVVERDQAVHAARAIEMSDQFASASVSEVLRQIADATIKPVSPQQPLETNSGLRCSAVLSLAKRGDPASRALIESLSTTTNPLDQASLAVSRCFLGDRSAIRAEHFKIDSLPFGYALLAALERQGDKEALDLIIANGFDFSWALLEDEAVYVVQRMTGRIWWPYGSKMHPSNWQDEIRAWWLSAKTDWHPPGRQASGGKVEEATQTPR